MTKLRVVGAGLPRTGTNSLKIALENLLGGRCYHMREIPGHPFDLGESWDRALAGDTRDLGKVLDGYVASVDWPASMFWRELSKANPDAIILLSLRDSAETWWQSIDATILPIARRALEPDWNEGRGLLDLLEHFAGTQDWDDPEIMKAAYERHNTEVKRTASPQRLLEWQASEGWEPICRALGLPVPQDPFPWSNRRSEWK
jgi:Sulfotransferase domain